MTTPVIAFSNQKGGPGKTTICLQTAFQLSARTDLENPILVIDFDAQGNTSTRLMQMNDLSQLEGTRTSDLFGQDNIEVRPTQTPYGCDLIFAEKNDVKLDDVSSMELESLLYPQKHLTDLINSGQYSAVLIDCPPSLGHKLYAALNLATHVFVPVEVSGFARDGIEGLMGSLERVKELNPDIELGGIIVNKFSSRSDRHKREVARLEGALGDLVLKERIGFRTSVDEANSDGVPIFSMQKGSAREAAKEMKLVVQEIMRRSGKPVKEIKPRNRRGN